MRTLNQPGILDSWKHRARGRELVVFEERGGAWRAFVVRASGDVEVVDLLRASESLDSDWIGLRMTVEAAASIPRERRDAFLEGTAAEANRALQSMRETLIDPLRLQTPEAYFVPTGVLHGIPLEALVDPDGSCRQLLRTPHPALVRSRRSERVGRAVFLRGHTPGVAGEAQMVGKLLREAGFRVSTRGEPDLKVDRGDPLRALHVAAHGVFHPRQWLLSGFQLEGGWLGLEHFTPGCLRGALVFFGSCESGLGRLGPGAELGNWVGAAVLAGASEMVFTLWKVDDATSLAFAEPFYRAWSAGSPATEAAAAARREVRAAYPHPFSWAPYMVIGG